SWGNFHGRWVWKASFKWYPGLSSMRFFARQVVGAWTGFRLMMFVRICRLCFVFVWLVLGISMPALARNVLFIGNSFTHGDDGRVQDHGGVSALFEAIAHGKGEEAAVTMADISGKDWAFHLTNAESAAVISSKVWD